MNESGPIRTKWPAAISTALFGALAVSHATTKLVTIDNTLILLVVLALLPWSLSWLSPFLKTLKIAGMELEFRQLEKDVAQTKADLAATASALTVGIGRQAKGDEAGGGIDPSDPNKGRFGGAAERNGLRLAGTATQMASSADIFRVVVWVNRADSMAPLPDGTDVLFVLHPTFSPDRVTVTVHNGVASLTRLALGGFTVGAEVGGVALELDLATLPGVPPEFAAR